jgi:centromere protein I
MAFLKDYVTLWDGHNDTDTVLALLSYLPLDPFQVAYTKFLQPVERTLQGRGLAAIDKLMRFYARLLQRQVCNTTSNVSRYGSPVQQSFVPLVEHVAALSMSLLVSIPSLDVGKSILSSILCFYEQLAASSKPHAIPIVLPPMHTVYLLAQQPSPESFSRLCGIISSYKQAFDEHPKPVKDYYATYITDALNWCLRDIYNVLWVSRGLITTDRKAAGLYCDPNLRTALNTYLMNIDREYAIGHAFGFSHNPWLASMSATAWQALEEREIQKENFERDSVRFHEGPVNQRSLEVLKKRGGVNVDWDGPLGYKVFVLNWMAERGMSGARDLMFATVSDLRGKV